MCMGVVLVVAITGEWSEDKSQLGSTVVYVEEIPFVMKKSNMSRCLLGSIGQYVGFPIVTNE